MGVLHYDIIVTLQLSKSALLNTSSTLCLLLFILCTHLKLTVVPRTSLSVRYLRINLASYQEPRRCSSLSFQISNPRWALRKIRHINFKVIIVFRTCQLNCQLHQNVYKRACLLLQYFQFVTKYVSMSQLFNYKQLSAMKSGFSFCPYPGCGRDTGHCTVCSLEPLGQSNHCCR